ncbi:MAG: hypothetical protein ACJ8FL_05200 [Sphingomicrobium sp.]
MSLPRSFGRMAQLSVAFATLRDPAKRRAYDAAIGLTPEPEQQRAPAKWREGKQFMMFAQARPREQAVHEPQPQRAAPKANPEPRQEPSAEPRMAAFLALAAREPASPQPERGTSPQAKPEAEALPPPQAPAEPAPEPPIAGDYAPERAEPHGLPDVDDSPIEWKRPAITLGGLLAAVAVLGGWAGLQAGNDIEAVQERAVTLALPPARAQSAIAAVTAPLPVPTRTRADAASERWTHAAIATASAERSAPEPQTAAPAKGTEVGGQSVGAELQDSAPAETANEQAVAEAAPASALAAKLPLSNATIARTIGRIGYACGQVASTSALEGEAPGVFTVTCTSGHSYRAAPVGGRYRFRRLGSR